MHFLIIRALKKIMWFWVALLVLSVVQSFWDFSPKMDKLITTSIAGLFILSITFFLSSLTTDLIVSYGKERKNNFTKTTLVQTVINIVIIALGVLLFLNHLGISITPLLTAMGVGGIALALGLQDTLANLFAGIYVTWAGKLSLGDYVKLDTEEEGYVADIAWRETQLKTLQNNLITIPNGKLAKATLINYSRPNQGVSFSIQLNVDYSSDLEQVEKISREVAIEIQQSPTEGVLSYQPRIYYTQLGDSSLVLSVSLRASEYALQDPLRHAFIKRLQARYRQEGIKIPYPTQVVINPH